MRPRPLLAPQVNEPIPPLAIRIALLREGARLPMYGTPGSTGMDLFACLPGTDDLLEIGSDPVLVPTGIALAIPSTHDVQIRPRSGLSSRGVVVPLGTIDSDYRGEIFVTMYTVGAREPHVVRHGDRIAQMVAAARTEVSLQVVETLDDTDRGAGGHGSTGN